MTTNRPQSPDHLARQTQTMNAIALRCVTDPGKASQELVRTLPLREVHPNLTWLWHVLLHVCAQRDHRAIGVEGADRARDLYVDCSGILLVDDGGGMPIEVFEDTVAIPALLAWLKARREQRARSGEVARRRNEFRVVEDRP